MSRSDVESRMRDQKCELEITRLERGERLTHDEIASVQEFIRDVLGFRASSRDIVTCSVPPYYKHTATWDVYKVLGVTLDVSETAARCMVRYSPLGGVIEFSQEWRAFLKKFRRTYSTQAWS